jgi:hypothetical protein
MYFVLQSSEPGMRDLDKALADILEIRIQLAAGTAFRGYGPGAVAVTGVLALAAATAQSIWLDTPGDPLIFFGYWTAVAIVSATVVGTEMVARTRRHHAGLADEMLWNAVQQFLPAAAVGVLLLAALLRFAPDTLWTLPGLWQILVGLGIFASLRIMPRAFALGGAWYIVAGFVVLALAAQSRELSPWLMGLPFGIGQLLIAGILRISCGEHDE